MDINQLLRSLGLQRAYQAYQENIGEPFAAVVGGAGRGYLGLDKPQYGGLLAEDMYKIGQAAGNSPIGIPAGAFKAAAQVPELLGLLGSVAPAIKAAKKVNDSSTSKPIRLLHGTTEIFGKFDVNKDNRNVGGVWLTDDSGYANWISRGGESKKSGNVIPVDAKIENPLVFDVYEQGKRFAKEIGVPEPRNSLEAQEILSGGMGWDKVVADLVKEAESRGFDAVKLERFDDNFGRETNAYVVFNPKNLQIATPPSQISFEDFLQSRGLIQEGKKIFKQLGGKRYEMSSSQVQKQWEEENKLIEAVKKKKSKKSSSYE